MVKICFFLIVKLFNLIFFLPFFLKQINFFLIGTQCFSKFIIFFFFILKQELSLQE